MSIRVMTYVWDCGQYNGSKLLLLLALADFAHDDGANVYPSVDTLAQKTRCDRRTVQRNLRQLEGEGAILLVRPATRHGPAEYQIGAAFVPLGAASDPNQGRRDAAQPVRESLNNPMFAVSRGRGGLDVKLDDIADRPGLLWSGAASDPNQGRRDAAQPVSKEPPKESINARERAHERAALPPASGWLRKNSTTGISTTPRRFRAARPRARSARRGWTHAVNTKHHQQRVRAPTAPRLRIERLDPRRGP